MNTFSSGKLISKVGEQLCLNRTLRFVKREFTSVGKICLNVSTGRIPLNGGTVRRKKLLANLSVSLNFNSSIIRQPLRKRFSINHELAYTIFTKKSYTGVRHGRASEALLRYIFIIVLSAKKKIKKKRNIFAK